MDIFVEGTIVTEMFHPIHLQWIVVLDVVCLLRFTLHSSPIFPFARQYYSTLVLLSSMVHSYGVVYRTRRPCTTLEWSCLLHIVKIVAAESGRETAYEHAWIKKTTNWIYTKENDKELCIKYNVNTREIDRKYAEYNKKKKLKYKTAKQHICTHTNRAQVQTTVPIQ